MPTEQVVNKIIDELDKSVLLSAAWDCMSEHGKDKFKRHLKRIISEQHLTDDPGPS